MSADPFHQNAGSCLPGPVLGIYGLIIQQKYKVKCFKCYIILLYQPELSFDEVETLLSFLKSIKFPFSRKKRNSAISWWKCYNSVLLSTKIFHNIFLVICRAQLGESIKTIIHSDYPEQWPSLLHWVTHNLELQNQIFGALYVLRVLARKYE